MDWLTKLILSIHGLIWGGALVIIIFLIFRRIKLKKKEDFEKRDN